MGLFDFFGKKKSADSDLSRREKTHERLKTMGIAINPYLPALEREREEYRSLDEICRRAVASLLAIQVACDLSQGTYGEEEKEFYAELFGRYDAMGYLNDKEKRVVMAEDYSEQDLTDVVWTYESYWSLLWALGLVDDISDASECCDCMKAVHTVSDCSSYDEFVSKCKLRPWNEIMDMLDLYYCYHWACRNKRINPDTSIGNLNAEVVWERRRGLEWLVGEEDDWFGISLDT